VFVVAGCSSPAAPEPVPSTESPLMPTASTVQLPDQELQLGAVLAGAPAQVTATGPAVVDLTTPSGDPAVVAALDCSACSGPVAVSSVATGSRWVDGAAPLTGQYLVDLSRGDDPGLLVEAEGEWSLRVLAAEDVPPSAGVQQGTGPAVVRLTDTGAQLWVLADAELTARAVALTGDRRSMSFGADGGVEQTLELAGPVLVGLDTTGRWSVQLRP